MNDKIGKHYLEDALYTFRYYKKLAERAFAQIGDEDFFKTLDEESNSIAVNMKHMAGNMLSRWTDFLTTDGEKPERNRDRERLAVCFRCGRTAQAGRPGTYRYDSRAGSYRCSGHQSTACPLRLSRGTDRLSGEAFQVERLAEFERSEK